MKTSVRTILSVLCMMAIFLSDPVYVFAQKDDTAQTAAKTVRVSDEEGGDTEAADENAEENADEKTEDAGTTEGNADAAEGYDTSQMTQISIGSYDEWCDFARRCSLDTWSEDKYVVLTDNIDFNMKTFVPVPLFAGVFDGCGHTISKAAYTEEQNYMGIFSKTASSAVIRDLNVIGVMKPAGKPFDIGGIVGDNAGMIAGCSFDGYVEGYDYIGGIAGGNEATGIISACTVTGKITGLHYVGGICGVNAGLVTGCSSAADINTVTKEVETGLSDIKVEEVFTSLLNLGREEGNRKSIQTSSNPVDIGGIVGHNTGEISTSVNKSSVGYEHVGYNVGGIAGRQSGYVHECSNNGYIRGRKDVGGIVGQAEPYIRLDLSRDIIEQLGNSINKLHDSIDRTIKDTGSSSGVVSARLNVIKDFADKALSDTGYLANGTTDFVNGVVGTTNELVDRMEYVLDETSKDGGPMDDISKAGDDLESSVDSLEEAAEDLDIYSYMDDDEALAYDNSKKALKYATEEYSGYYKDTYEETYPVYFDKKYYQLLTGNPVTPEERPSEEDIELAEVGKSDEQLKKANDAAEVFANAEAGGYAAKTARKSYEKAHEGHTYAEDMEEYADTIAETILAHADDMAVFVTEDGKDAIEDVRQMAGSIRDAGGHIKEIIGNVSGRGSVQFPQLSDEYKLHTNSLVANIQGMSDNMGFLNSEMKGATDTVCNDLEGVNDQFSSLMMLFTDAMDGALDMDYSDVFEDESNDVCEDSVDATIANCDNRGMVYGDINSGGIAGTMAEEYDFDLEGDITGVKDASRKSTYRTKCVLREDINRGEVKGRKSYAGGSCGLAEIGTILRCSNFAKIHSESSDYVGGIAGRSYSTIRNSYEKGLLAGGSYIGGIAGTGTDITDCVAMPVITDGVNFRGAIAGTIDDEGKISGNVFVSDSLAGIDRISMSGEAEPVSYKELLSREDVPDDFGVMKVSFIVGDRTVATVDKKAGEVISPDETPLETEIASKESGSENSENPADEDRVQLGEDEYIDWDCYEEISVDEDMEIKGEVIRYTSSLASEQVLDNRQSLFLVDGRFLKNDELKVSPLPSGEADSEEYMLSIPTDGALSHRIRYQPSGDDKIITVYVKNGDAYEEAECENYGRYITFDADGRDVDVMIKTRDKPDYTIWYIIGGSAAALLLLLIIFIKVIRAKRRKKRAAAAAAATEAHRSEADALSDVEDLAEDASTDGGSATKGQPAALRNEQSAALRSEQSAPERE